MGKGSAGHGATATAGALVQSPRMHNMGSHVGATKRGGPSVANGAVSTFRPAAMSAAQVAVVRQNVPIPERVLGLRNSHPTANRVNKYVTGTPRI